MAGKVFISYSRADMVRTNWVDRLSLYLAQYRGHGLEEWNDKKIHPGSDWLGEINHALKTANAAVFLVGPGFLASRFVMENEVPVLIRAATKRGLALFPLIVSISSYESSPLRAFQAVNEPTKPLDAQDVPRQNEVLNDLAIKVNAALSSKKSPDRRVETEKIRVGAVLQRIHSLLGESRTLFVAQCRRRDGLVVDIRKRLKIRESLEYEQFFFQAYSRLNKSEHFQFAQIRAMSDGLRVVNRKLLLTIDKHPQVLSRVRGMVDLRQHLVFWLNKYKRVFVENRAMCVLYAGVEDGVPFPSGIDESVEQAIPKSKRASSRLRRPGRESEGSWGEDFESED